MKKMSPDNKKAWPLLGWPGAVKMLLARSLGIQAGETFNPC